MALKDWKNIQKRATMVTFGKGLKKNRITYEKYVDVWKVQKGWYLTIDSKHKKDVLYSSKLKALNAAIAYMRKH